MTNLVVNPGAESSLVTGWSGATGVSSTGWKRSSNNAWVHNGTYAFYTACSNSNNCLPMGQNISFTPGINYKLSLYVYQVGAGQGAFSLKIDQSTLISDTTSIYSYVQYSAIFQRSISEGYLEIRGVTENFLAIDDISITETNETNLPSATPSGVPSSYPGSAPSAPPIGVPSSYPSSAPTVAPSGTPTHINLVTNPGAEDGSTGWSRSGATSTSTGWVGYCSINNHWKRSGDCSFFTQCASNCLPFVQNISFVPGHNYKISIFAYHDHDDSTLSLKVDQLSLISITNIPSSFTEYMVIFTASNSISSLRIEGTASNILAFDDLSITETTETNIPSATPSESPSSYPSSIPSATPSGVPSSYPSSIPSATPSGVPSSYPSSIPSATPSGVPSSYPSSAPSATPSESPSSYPSSIPSATPSGVPSSYPSSA
ncbi:MAG: hypothetical protein N4A31_06305, partial [Rickettsiales bacterium]|nr:hypothetical protein [Rickettsiales bacterium]